jgi:uncharacterized protein YndB with AHSA1/START domain/DNA-binding transcriptional ArsR family regulator
MASVEAGATGVDEVFKALADPSRRRLLDRLNEQNGQSLRELGAGLGMARQSVSKHLAVLEAANLVTSVRRGREKLHYLNAAPISDIADRWISHYDRARVDALADLKRALEGTTMEKPEFVYTTYIRTTPELLWRALTEPAFTQRYWNTSFHSTWEVGAPMTWDHHGVTIADPEQVVLEYDPFHRLSYTWHTFTPELADAVGISADVMARCSAERRRSKVTFELEPVSRSGTEPAGALTKLTVVHDGFDDGSLVAELVSGGWPRVVSALKTMLEQDEPAAADASLTRVDDESGYGADVTIAAPRARVLAALSTLDGLAGWWTPTVSGDPTPGGEITFTFGDANAVMRVDRVDGLIVRSGTEPVVRSGTEPVVRSGTEPASVVWTCLSSSALPEWSGTTIHFDLVDRGSDTTLLEFRHVGLVPAFECFSQCELGWGHFLPSLAALAAGAEASPWSSEQETARRVAAAR